MAAKRGQQTPSHPLRGHHTRLVKLFEDLVAEARKDDRSKLRPMWATFEGAILAHINAEEAELLPPYRRGHPVEARAIEEDHVFFRRALTEFGVDLDLHLMRADAVESFMRRLRDHALSEDGGLYPWAAREVSTEVQERFRRAAEGLPLEPKKDASGIGLP